MQCLSLVLCIVQYQNYARTEAYYELASNWIRFFILFIQIMSVIVVILRYNSELEIAKFKLNRVDENLGLS
jgi:hypothetical protein